MFFLLPDGITEEEDASSRCMSTYCFGRISEAHQAMDGCAPEDRRKDTPLRPHGQKGADITCRVVDMKSIVP